VPRIKHIVFSLLLVAFAVAVAYPQTAPSKTDSKPSTPAPAATPTAAEYTELVTKLKAGDLKIDFAKLRMAFTATKDYSYHGSDATERSKMLKLLAGEKFKDALKAAEKVLDTQYVNINAHYVAYLSNKNLKNSEKADFHRAVLVGLLSSIKQDNDGLSTATPFTVISIEEEYATLRFLGLTVKMQGLNRADGHTFDVFTVIDGETKKESKIYFNIDRIWKAETELFSN